MPNYFDYILEFSQEDIDDIDNVYNETDLTVAEFDLYVQEGVWMKIAIGLGIAALLGALIAVIIKVFGNRSDNSSGNNIEHSTKIANTFLDKCERAGIKTIELKEKHIDLTEAWGIMYYSKWSVDRLIRYISDIIIVICHIPTSPSDDPSYDFKEKHKQIYSDLEKLKKMIDDNYGKSISNISNLFKESETVNVYSVRNEINSSRDARKQLLKETKKLNEHRKQIKDNSNILPERHMKLFEEITTRISAIILELDTAVYETFKQIINTCMKALKEKDQYKDGEKLSFDDEIGNAFDRLVNNDPNLPNIDSSFEYEPKQYDNTLDEMKISAKEGD